jgi:transcriptional regulator with XRE-family HTH domain
VAAYKPRPGASSPLRELRRLSGLSRPELAARAGLATSTLQHIEGGGDPRLSTARALARELRVRIDDAFPDQEAH